MFGDFDIEEFESMWVELIAEFGLENNNWIHELYEKREQWSTAHIRGRFYVGFRTTSKGVKVFILNLENMLLSCQIW
jgi:hypothetical protein